MELSRFIASFEASAFSELLYHIASTLLCQSSFLTFFRLLSKHSCPSFEGDALLASVGLSRKVLIHSIKDDCFCQLVFTTFFIFFYFTVRTLWFFEIPDSKCNLNKWRGNCQPLFMTFFGVLQFSFPYPSFSTLNSVHTYYISFFYSYTFGNLSLCIQNKEDPLPN